MRRTLARILNTTLDELAAIALGLATLAVAILCWATL